MTPKVGDKVVVVHGTAKQVGLTGKITALYPTNPNDGETPICVRLRNGFLHVRLSQVRTTNEGESK